MIKKSLKILLIVITILMMLPINNNVYAGTYGEVLDALAKAEKELEQNKASLGNISGQINQNNATIQNLKNGIEAMKTENTKLQQEIADANTDIEKKKEETKNLVTYYQMSQGENVYLDYVFGSDSVTDMVYRLSIVEQITEYNNKMVKELEDLITTNEKKKVELAENEKKSEEKIGNLNTEIANLNKTKANLNSLSPSLESEVQSQKKLVEFYKSQGCSNRSDVIGVDCARTSSNAIFYRPIKNGYVTSFTGYRWLCLNGKCQHSFHKGIDLGSKTGSNTPIYSIGYGYVSTIWNDTAGALCVNTQHLANNGKYYTAVYCHLSRRANLYVGMKVTPDTLIGYMGATGNVTGVHLHLEVYPCKLWDSSDKNCSNWSKYVNYTKGLFDAGNYKGSESVINFPNRTYLTWNSR